MGIKERYRDCDIGELLAEVSEKEVLASLVEAVAAAKSPKNDDEQQRFRGKKQAPSKPSQSDNEFKSLTRKNNIEVEENEIEHSPLLGEYSSSDERIRRAIRDSSSYDFMPHSEESVDRRFSNSKMLETNRFNNIESRDNYMNSLQRIQVKRKLHLHLNQHNRRQSNVSITSEPTITNTLQIGDSRFDSYEIARKNDDLDVSRIEDTESGMKEMKCEEQGNGLKMEDESGTKQQCKFVKENVVENLQAGKETVRQRDMESRGATYCKGSFKEVAECQGESCPG